MVIRHIAYCSAATRPGNNADIDRLLLDARQFNAQHRVSGVLLYDGRHFFQYFEGSCYATDQVMARISRSRLHQDIHLLADGCNDKREFERWHMGFIHAPASFLQQLENGNWQQTLYRKRTTEHHSDALQLLFAHLDNSLTSPGLALASSTDKDTA